MKKTFGHILLVIGILIELMILLAIIPGITDFTTFVVMIFMLIPGALLIWLGIRMGEKKRFEDRTENTSVLSEIRDHTQQKLSAVPERGYSVPVDELYQSYLSFNDNKLPFAFYKSEHPKSHITAHWKFGDAAYLGIMGLSKHKVQKEFNVLMKLDAENSQVRCMDLSKSSSSGFSPMGGGMEFCTFKGKQSSVSKEIHFGRREDGSFGKVADMNLDTRILHNAIAEIAEKNGWQVKRVVKL